MARLERGIEQASSFSDLHWKDICMVQLNHLHKYLGSRKGQIAIGVLLLIILGCISPTAGTVAFCLLFSLGIWFGLHKLITRNGRHRSLDIAVSAIMCVFTIGLVWTAATAKPQTVQEQPQAPPAQEQASSEESDSRQDEAAAATQVVSEPQKLDTLTVRFVDVGQGDGSIIEFPDGKTMVIDAGRDRDSGAAMNATLSADGRQQIDWAVATHPDADHIGGMPAVISANSVGSVWAPDCNHDTETFTRFLQSVADKGLSIDAAARGKTIATGDSYSIEILWPDVGASFEDTNDYSVVIKVTYGKTTFLFTGDATTEDLLKADCGDIDVLKVAHHGSDTGTSPALLTALTPKIAVISYGLDNSYGHPTQAVLDALSAAGATVYGTGAQGTITVTSDGVDVTATPAHDGTVVAGTKAEEKKEETQGNSASAQEAAPAQQEQQAAPEASQPAQQAAPEASQDRTVYVTASGKGKSYHLDPNCRTLRRSKSVVSMTESEAKAEGYKMCSVCGY